MPLWTFVRQVIQKFCFLVDWLLRWVECGIVMFGMPNKLDFGWVDMVFRKWRPVIWLRVVLLTITGVAYVISGSSISFAQYPGSAYIPAVAVDSEALDSVSQSTVEAAMCAAGSSADVCQSLKEAKSCLI